MYPFTQCQCTEPLALRELGLSHIFPMISFKRFVVVLHLECGSLLLVFQ